MLFYFQNTATLKVRTMDFDFIIRFENGEANKDEIVREFQKMIHNGIVWTLQGFYGRYAKKLIEEGVCHA